jgi:hypothetical protein
MKPEVHCQSGAHARYGALGVIAPPLPSDTSASPHSSHRLYRGLELANSNDKIIRLKSSYLADPRCDDPFSWC